MKKDIKMGDWVRTFHVRKDRETRIIPGKMYKIMKVNSNSSLGGFYIVDESGKTIYCLQQEDCSLVHRGCWEVFNFEKNLKTILK